MREKSERKNYIEKTPLGPPKTYVRPFSNFLPCFFARFKTVDNQELAHVCILSAKTRRGRVNF